MNRETIYINCEAEIGAVEIKGNNYYCRIRKEDQKTSISPRRELNLLKPKTYIM